VAQLELSEAAQHWVNVIVLWIGFGTLVGLLARALLPGREPRSFVGTVVIGIVGSVLGPLVLTSTLKFSSFNPIGPLGFIVSTAGALVLLVAYRLAVTVFARDEDDLL
jgi:uncharacterized membrane protein YeaQ/YmgE (transglycosylase-associated protein family)